MPTRTNIPRTLEAEFTGAATIHAAAANKKRGPRRFEMLAYGGGPMRPKLDPPMPYPVIVDLAGMDLSKQRLPALKDHDERAHIGHTEVIETDGRRLTAAGVVSGAGPAAREVVEANDNGFEWPVSIGASLDKLQFIRDGASANVNGRAVTGPLYIARASRPHEISFLTVAACDEAVARIAAMKNRSKTGAAAVDDFPTATLEETAELNAGLDDQHADTDDAPPSRADVRERRRVAAMEAMLGDDSTMLARGIADGWDVNTAERVMKAQELRGALPRASMNAGTRGDGPDKGAVMEAAMCMTAGITPDFLKANGVPERAINAAQAAPFRGLGLQQAFRQVIMAAGNNANVNGDALIREAFIADRKMQAAQFSTVSLPNILANVGNKFLLEAFAAVENAWRAIARRRPASDFKPSTSIRLTGDATFEELPEAGEIKHGTLAEENYANQVRTYAKMYGLTRQLIVNDDLNAFAAIPRKLGRGAALKLNQVFWATFLADHGTFFTSGRGNYITGTTTNLSAAGLALAMVKFRRQVDADGELLALRPAVLLVPPELEAVALELTQTITFNAGGAATGTQIASANIYRGTLDVVVSSYLTEPLAWYLIASPNELPVIEVAFLNGKEAPTIEQSDADFNTLGVLFRGYWDLGTAMQDYRAALKSKGAA